MTGFTKIITVLEGRLTDNFASDCMCPEKESRPSEGSRRGQVHTAAGRNNRQRGKEGHHCGRRKQYCGSDELGTADIPRPLSRFACKETDCCSVLNVKSSTTLKADKRLCSTLRTVCMSWTCAYHWALRVLIDDRDDSLVCWWSASEESCESFKFTNVGWIWGGGGRRRASEQLSVGRTDCTVRKRSLRRLRKSEKVIRGLYRRVLRQNKCESTD